MTEPDRLPSGTEASPTVASWPGGSRRWVRSSAVLLILVVGVQIVRQGNKVDQLERSVSDPDAVRRAAETARLAPGARQVALRSADGALSASVVILRNGTGYLEENNLPELGAGETHQLWAVVRGADTSTVVSAGVLGPAATVSPFRVHGKVVAFAVTQEKSPGVVESHHKPVLSGNLSA